ncbi:caspase-7-like isoform X1 [Amblyomma americanum]
MASSWYSPDAQLIPRDAATTHRLRALTSRYVPVVNELVDVDQVRFAFLLFGTMNSRHGAARHPCSRPLVDYLTGVTSDFRVVRSCVDECGESADEIVLEILYVMHKFEPMRRIFGVCKHRAGTLFQSPRRIGKFWRELANFCEACLDEEAVEILRHFLPETSMSTVATHAEAVVVLLYENGIITLDNYSALYEHIREKYNNEELLEHLCETIPQYPMTNSPHGYAVILNHSTFKDSKNVIELEDRHGTEKDVGALKQLWEELDFEVRVYNDYTADEIEDLLKEVATVWDHRRSDAFIFVVLSHGYRGGFYASDCRKVDLETVESFLCEKCNGLKDKPKVLCVQACQIGDASDEPARGVGERRSRAHVLKFMSTVSNSLSYRDPHYGSVFVQAFVDAVRRHWRNHDLLQIGTFINSGVADKPIPVVSSDGRNINWSSQTSEVSNTLTRALYLGRR